jgi:hypothetical protein
MLLAQVYNFRPGFSTGQICVYFQNPAFWRKTVAASEFLQALSLFPRQRHKNSPLQGSALSRKGLCCAARRGSTI